RALRFCFVLDRPAEHRHDRVPDEFLDEAVVARDRLGQRLEQRVLERAHLLGVETLGQGGEAAEVGEEHGDLAAIGLGHSGSRGKSLPTARTEREVGSRFEAATGGGHGRGRLRYQPGAILPCSTSGSCRRARGSRGPSGWCLPATLPPCTPCRPRDRGWCPPCRYR